MTDKETLIDIIKKARPNVKDSTIKMYTANLTKLKKLFDSEDYKFLKDPEKVNEKLGDLHYTTKRNYYNAILIYLMAIAKDDKDMKEDPLIIKYNEMRDQGNQTYQDNQATGVISDKQKASFVPIEEINKMIEEMGQEIKDQKIKKKADLTAKDKALIQSYILFNIYTRLPLRNDVAGMETINKRSYNKLSQEEKKSKNHLVVNKNTIFMELNKFKTSAKYESIKIPIEKDLEKLLRFYIRVNGMGVLFKSGTGKALTRNELSKLLIKETKKRMGKSISTTMLRKIYLSSKYADVKEDMENDAKIMGHSVATGQSVYVKKAQEEEPK